ncbi:Vps4 activity regulator, partial [Helicosporidium sp. ATCC 50920]
MLDRWLFNTNKLKTQCKLCISRIKLMRNKKQLSVKQLLKEVGELLRQSKEDNAWIRVESAIHERQLLRAYDLLEVYLELLAVRVDLLAKIQAMPPDMMEAICSVVYASQRLSGDLAELPAIRKLLVSKYDKSYKDFAVSASSDLTYRDWHVNESL